MSTISPWKHDFPIFSANAYPKLCYLDSAATCLTPKHVADAIYYYQCFSHANSHKGLYQLSVNATEIVENARESIAKFIGAVADESIVFTASATESINLVAQSYLLNKMSANSNIVISATEHHANLLPWQNLCRHFGAQLRVVPLNKNGLIDTLALQQLLDSDTVLVAINHVSNLLGLINPVKAVVKIAHQKSIPVLVDGAQAVRYGPVSFTELGCDFYVFSAHKIYGATGTGVLVAKSFYLEQMSPYQLGAGIVTSVDYQQVQYVTGALKFEPGSHNVAGIVGLVEAIDYLHDISWSEVTAHLDSLSSYLMAQLQDLPYIQPLFKTMPENVPPNDSTLNNEKLQFPSLHSFTLQGIDSHDVASLLDGADIAVRAGNHCVQPFHKQQGVDASIRISLGLYNDFEDIDRLITGLDDAHRLLTDRPETTQ
jgi:cysteine desulfurase/selenocysteine lyase